MTPLLLCIIQCLIYLYTVSYTVNGLFFCTVHIFFFPVLRGHMFRRYPSSVIESMWPWVFTSVIREALDPTKGCPREGLDRVGGNSFLFLGLTLLGLGLKSLVMLEGTARLSKDSLCHLGDTCVRSISETSRQLDIWERKGRWLNY